MSTFLRLRYEQARRNVLGLRNTLKAVGDKDTARNWVQGFGEAMRDLSKLGQSAGIAAAEDRDVCDLHDFARKSLVLFATSEWLRLAPGLVSDLKELVQGLSPGVSLGEAFSDLVSGVPQAGVSTPAPSTSRSSIPSPSTPPPLSHMPSSSFGISRPSPHELAIEPATQTTHPLPRATRRQPRDPPLEDVPPPPSATVTARITLPHGPRRAAPAVASTLTTAAPPAASTRPSKKQSAVAVAMKDRPAGWQTCTSCRKRKQKCTPPKGAKPPFTSCFMCLRNKVKCVTASSSSVPSHSHHHQRSSRRLTLAKPATLPASSLRSGPSTLPADEKFPENLPPVPLRGTTLAPLKDLLSWHAEIRAAVHEHSAATVAHQAAVTQEKIAASHVASADERRRTAWAHYFFLMGSAWVDHQSPAAARASDDSLAEGEGMGQGGTPLSEDEEEVVSRELEGDSEDVEGDMDVPQ